MKLYILEKLRKIAKEKIGDSWIGIESYFFNGRWHLICIACKSNPYRIELAIENEASIVKCEEIKRVPMYVIYVDSALEELENARKLIENNDFDRAIKSLWGSVIYSLKAYGLVFKRCRIVEVSIMDLAKEFSELINDKNFLNKIERIKFALDPFGASDFDLGLMYEDARDVVEKILSRILR